MTTAEATAKVFCTALRALPKKEKEAVVEQLLKDKEFLEDLIDIAIIEQRRKEPSRSLDEYLKRRKRQLMPYIVSLKRSAEKELEHLPNKIHDRIVNHLISQKENPRPNKAKKLHGREGYRIRVGDYRILYVIDDKEKKVEALSFAHRREVYRF